MTSGSQNKKVKKEEEKREVDLVCCGGNVDPMSRGMEARRIVDSSLAQWVSAWVGEKLRGPGVHWVSVWVGEKLRYNSKCLGRRETEKGCGPIGECDWVAEKLRGGVVQWGSVTG